MPFITTENAKASFLQSQINPSNDTVFPTVADVNKSLLCCVSTFRDFQWTL